MFNIFKYLIENWKYRAGADLTDSNGNVHIHLDLGQTHNTELPFFFIEDSGKYIKQIFKKEEIK